jgi:hypothetical protein
MAKGSVVQFLLSGVKDASGNVLSSGQVLSYEAGSFTPKNLFLDSDLTIPAANPLLLSPNGTAHVYADGAYRLVVAQASPAFSITYDDIYFGEGVFETYVPTITAETTMTIGAITVHSARVLRFPTSKFTFFFVDFTGTIGTPAANLAVRVSLPSEVVGGLFLGAGGHAVTTTVNGAHGVLASSTVARYIDTPTRTFTAAATRFNLGGVYQSV